MSVTLTEFIRSLADNGLMAADEVQAVVERLPPMSRPTEAADLAKELYRRKRLTKFQAQAVYQGKTKGLVLGKYVVLDELGRGGMGRVYKAEHRVMKRVVALKVLPSVSRRSQRAVKRFRREVEVAARLSHPNIVTAYDADEAKGIHFLAMECVDGDDLASVTRSHGPLPISQAIDYILQAARGLEYAHSHHVIHRDIKPSNLIVDTEGTVKILDMGLARISGLTGSTDSTSEESLTDTGRALGTPDFLPPEQADSSRSVDQRADIYSLGCTLFYLLTGRTVYSGDTVASKLLAHREAPIPSLSAERDGVPESLDAAFRKMVAKAPEDRYVSMAEVIAALDRCAAARQAQIADTVTLGTEPPPVQTRVTADLGQTPADELPWLDLPVVSPVDEFLRTHASGGRRQVIAGSLVALVGFLALAFYAVILAMKTADDKPKPAEPSTPAEKAGPLMRFDFQPYRGQVDGEWIPVGARLLYSPETGYGWLNPPHRAIVFDEDVGEPYRDCCYNFAKRGEFRVDLPNGKYRVTSHFCSAETRHSHRVRLTADGRVCIEDLVVPAGDEVLNPDYEVLVTEGKLVQTIERTDSGTGKHWIWNGFTVQR